jgi:hypothetical protein
MALYIQVPTRPMGELLTTLFANKELFGKFLHFPQISKAMLEGLS